MGSFEGAIVAQVDRDAGAYEVGLKSGCRILEVNGKPLRDALDWQWESAEDEIDITYVDGAGELREGHLERDDATPWGIAFDQIIFDDVMQCKNACTFCFMRQLPAGMRASLSVRDDDFRLSFTQGNFVTLTNLSEDDVNRIIEQRISPLRVSLHAVDADVRRELMGRHAARGLDALEQLLDAGIEFDAQIVLVPGVNDGDVLQETLQWAYERSGIRMVGIVPLGYTRHQNRFDHSFEAPACARSVIASLDALQKRAQHERGYAWVYASDEFYCNAYGDTVSEHIPPASFYGTYEMFEDGIGIIRSSIDEFAYAVAQGVAARVAHTVRSSAHTFYQICGCAMKGYYDQLLKSSPLADLLQPLFVKNDFFGGNVDVTGLLCGKDIVCAIQSRMRDGMNNGSLMPPPSTKDESSPAIYVVPDVIFNADGLTLDDMTLEDIRCQTGALIKVVPSNPLDCMEQIEKIAEGI